MVAWVYRLRLRLWFRPPPEMTDPRILFELWLESNGLDRITLESAEVGSFVRWVKDIVGEMIGGATGCIDSFSTNALPLRVEKDVEYEAIHWSPFKFIVKVKLKWARDLFSGTAQRKPFHFKSPSFRGNPMVHLHRQPRWRRAESLWEVLMQPFSRINWFRHFFIFTFHIDCVCNLRKVPRDPNINCIILGIVSNDIWCGLLSCLHATLKIWSFSAFDSVIQVELSP